MILISDVLKYSDEEYEKFSNRYCIPGAYAGYGCYGFGNLRLRDERFAKFNANVIGVYPKAGENGEDQYLVRVNFSGNLDFTCICNHDEIINLGPMYAT